MKQKYFIKMCFLNSRLMSQLQLVTMTRGSRRRGNDYRMSWSDSTHSSWNSHHLDRVLLQGQSIELGKGELQS